MKRDRSMDIAIILLILIIIIAIAVVMILFNIQDHNMALYERRMRANSDHDARILSAAKTLIVGQFVYITRGVNERGLILYDVKQLSPRAEQAVNTAAIPVDATVHQLAVKWVMMSIDESGKGGTKLLPESKVREAGLITDPGRWVDVGDYLSEHFGVIKISNRGRENGTFTASGKTLSDLLLALSVASLAPAPPRETM